MRILIAGDSVPPKIDGVAIRAGHTVRMLQALGHTVHVVTSIRPSNQPLYGAQVTQLAGFYSSYYPQHSMTIPSWKLVVAFFSFRPHVIHILDESFLAAATQMVASVLLIPTVWSHHSRLDLFAVAYIPFLGIAGFNFIGMHILRRMFASQADVHLAVGEDMRAQLEAAACEDVTLWECGCDCDGFNPIHREGGWPVADGPNCNDAIVPSPVKQIEKKPSFLMRLRKQKQSPSPTIQHQSLRNKLSLSNPSRPIILYVGRVAPEKNLDVYPQLIDEMAIAAKNEGWEEPSWVFVGDGPALKPLQASVIGKPCVFMGQIQQGSSDNLLGRIYATSDVFYSPSHSETLGQVFQEAMASGTPPVGARAGGVPDAFTDKVEGFLVEPNEDKNVFIQNSVKAIVAALKARAMPRNKAKPGTHICERGRARAERKSWHEALAQAVAAYNRSIRTRWYVS
jgi:glycosyltransferase involved in cell wall biosynthesis